MNRNFLLGSAGGLMLFIAINILAAHLSSDCGLAAVFGRDACADDIVRAGWPLRFYEEGGFAYRSNFSGPFLLINTAIGVVFAIFAGWMYSRSKKALPK